MFRVITTYRAAGAQRPIVERGPWHQTQDTARYWADVLSGSGYVTKIESQRGAADEGANALADALASMA